MLKSKMNELRLVMQSLDQEIQRQWWIFPSMELQAPKQKARHFSVAYPLFLRPNHREEKKDLKPLVVL